MAHDTHDPAHGSASHSDHAAIGEVHEHPTWPTYWKIALILTLITVIEVWVYYVPSFVASRLFVPVLLTMSAVKFATVVAFYMHLKYDHKLFRALFTGHVDLPSIGRTPRDELWIEGSVPLHYVIEPGLNPQSGASAMIANSVRRVADARPGWLTVADLPPATPF